MPLKQYTRNCSDCSCEVKYKNYRQFWRARRNNSTCRPCFYKSLVGHKLSGETKKKIGEANKIALLGHIPWNKGKPSSVELRERLSKIHMGKIVSNETKKKHRISQLERFKRTGIPLNIDRGAPEFFADFNKKNDTNLKPKTFWDLGYIADGYDENKHIWAEFDPPHHFYIDGALKPKDIIRQKNIIEHFENSGNPLSEFIRIKSDSNGVPLKIETIYKGTK
jgi:hypothetical protein